MKILAVDPGTRRSGCVCLAVPPPPKNLEGEYCPVEVHAYAELMLHNADASVMAAGIRDLTGGMKFETFVIDMRAGKQTPMGFKHTVQEQYSLELAKLGVQSRVTGSSFEWGSDDVDGRELLVKDWIRPPNPVLRVQRHMYNLNRQMIDFYRKKTDTTKREEHKELELVHALEYAVAHFGGRLYYNEPEPVDIPTHDDPTLRLLDKMREQWNPSKNTAPSFGALD
jgi:hypothetical protein